MFKIKSYKRKSQALIELIISIALAVFFLTAFIVNISFVTTKFSEYKEKNYATLLGRGQKEMNDRNIAYFVAMNKLTEDYLTNEYFPNQGSHLNFNYINYEGNEDSTFFRNQEKKFFLEDDYVYYWSMDAIPDDSTYILDDAGEVRRQGTISCLGSSCQNVDIIDRSFSRCVSNNCLRFYDDTNSTASTITFPDSNIIMSDLYNKARAKTSWEAWIKVDNKDKDQVFISRGDNNYLGIIDSKPTVVFKIGDDSRQLSSVNSIVNNQWHHIVASYDGTNIRIYLDGVLEATSSNYSGLLGFNDILKFGFYKSDNLMGMSGYLDEVKIYGKALTDKEVENRFNAFNNQIGLLAHWHFDDAINVATYNDITETGLNPRFVSFSAPDNIPMYIEKAFAQNNYLDCKSGSCIILEKDFSSKGTFSDPLGTYSHFHELDNISIGLKIKANSFSDGYQGLFNKDNEGVYGVGLYENDIQFALKIDGTRYIKTYDANLSTDTWYQLDFTFDGTDMKLYIDGLEKASWSQPGSISNDASFEDIIVGYSGASSEYFDGYIDEIRIYNKALTRNQIINRFANHFTYYQYFKPVCRATAGSVVGCECLNCNPTNSSECLRATDPDNFEPFLIKSFHIVKYGKGINYKTYRNEQIIPVVNSFYVQEAGPNIWGAGLASSYGQTCGKFVFGMEGESAGSNIKYNSACGDSSCGRLITGAEVCSADNISFYYPNGCTTCSGTPGNENWTCDLCEAEGYFTKTDPDTSGYFISPTFNFPKQMGLMAFSWDGTGMPINVQIACLDSITDENGDEVSEDSWTYVGPDPLNPRRCSSDYYYNSLLADSTSVSSCWESDNVSTYNCQFFRFKVYASSSDVLNVNSLRFIFGQYPYTVIKQK